MSLSETVVHPAPVPATDVRGPATSRPHFVASASGSSRLAAVEALDFLSAEYRELYATSAATVFQAPLWMHRLHTQLAPRLGARPHTIAVRDRESGALQAVIALVAQKSMGVTLLQPADFGTCDSNAIVASARDIGGDGRRRRADRRDRRSSVGG